MRGVQEHGIGDHEYHDTHPVVIDFIGFFFFLICLILASKRS